ncbi:alpha-mannosidase [Citrus sinensis]|uniref:Alpha-mannosidase n=1 Tax=Citrus sinensis TaxID=2711 RepID=A0ACB8LA13_CITSI|nr:alpha-mannosidase [Citrus sinensis]
MMYNTSAGIVPGKINVHLVPHSHDDVGWLKTVDQYYVGSNNSIQVACVQNVLDSLIPALVADKNRKFIYVEQAITHGFFALLSFDFLLEINGGMCMHDEAAPHYIDMIDQTTLGHRYIKEQFNVTPRIGWQIDPFGHSAVQAYLLSAEVGFDFLFFARIDYQDRAKRINEKTLEVVWRASKSLGSSAQIMTGISPKNYEPPSDNFYFEVGDTSPIVQDDMNLFDYNVPERVNDFVSAAIAQANITRTNHIMWTMGTDFKYQYAHTWFRQMDKFIHYVNQDGRVNALYSTPSMYIDAKYAANESWPLKTDDFFPYADRENAYWTGYFTSRPALKGYVRTMSAYYLAARQLEFFKGRNEVGLSTDSLADALALVQHHDAVSGTEKQHVADDYAKRLSIGYTECPLLNISYCPPSEVDLSSGKSLVVVVYNPLGWKREDIIRIPVINENVTVKDSKGKVIESQLLPLLKDSMSLRNSYSTAYLGKSTNVTPSYWLAFSASVPPLGFNTYIISSAKQAASHSGMRTVYKSQISQNDTIEVGPGNLKLLYSGKRAKLMRYINSKTSVNKLLEQSYIYYRGDDGSKDLQVTRVYKGKDHAEIEFTVGPIPIDDGIGKEVVTQITSNMISNKTFYTDSSGRDFIERIRDYRKDWNLEVNQPIAGNYYPVNLGIYMKDNSSELSILVDRSVGGSSIADGQLELMLHRRLVADDNRGVSEALNETVCVFDKCEGLTIIGKYYLRIDPVGEAAKWRRSFGQEIYSPFLLAFTEQDGDHWANSHLATYSAMDTTYVLPDNVALITLQELDSGKVLLRLAHLYEIEEDTDLSVMSSVELKKVFPKKKISKVTEMNLSANQERAVMEKKRLVWRVEGSSKEQPTAVRGSPVDPAKLVVELAPMEIRTFVIEFYSERGSFSDALYRRSNLRRKATFSLP